MPIKDGICKDCGLFKKARELTILNKKKVCRSCLRERRASKFGKIKTKIDGEFKERIKLEKNAKNRAKRAELRKELPPKPKIKPIKKKFVRGIHMFLTKIERQIIFKKCLKMGMSEESALDRINNDVRYLQNLVEKLRSKGVKDVEINRRFKEEFAKLCIQPEVIAR